MKCEICSECTFKGDMTECPKRDKYLFEAIQEEK